VTIIAAIHGDELNGIRILHELAAYLEETGIPVKGSICLVPVANLMGYTNHSRYLPDRRDLNRMFPGLREGSEGARLAYFIWSHFACDADFLVDVHSGSYNRWNFPHVRGDMKNETMRFYASRLQDQLILTSTGVIGSLRKEAGKLNKPVFLIEAGETGRFEKKIVGAGLVILLQILDAFGFIKYNAEKIGTPIGLQNAPQKEAPRGYYRKAIWQRATHAGLFIPRVDAGAYVSRGDVLGDITDLLGKKRAEILAHEDGRILGMHLHPQVVPGRALFHVAYDFKKF